jgi:hypothetical protein
MFLNRRHVRARISGDSVIRDATTEMRDLCVSVLRVSASQLCLSHIVF